MNFENLRSYQKEVYGILLKESPLAARAYLGAIITYNQEDNPDKFHQIANSLRHISSIIARDIIIERDQEEYGSLLDFFNNYLKENNLDHKYEVSIMVEKDITHLKKLELKVAKDPDILPEISRIHLDKLIKEWLRIHNFFHSIAHYGYEQIDEENFDINFKKLERILMELFKSSKETIRKLNELLEINNPEEKHLEILKKNLLTPADSQLFFVNLDNPNWFDILQQNNYFCLPKKDESGLLNIHFFPQIHYLKNISEIIPDKVITILQELSNSGNIILFRGIALCILEMPIVKVKNAMSIIEAMVKTQDISLYSILKKLIYKLIELKEFKSILIIIREMFNFKNSQPTKLPGIKGFDVYRYLLSEYRDIFEAILLSGDEESIIELLEILCFCLGEQIKKKIIRNIKFGDEINNRTTEITDEILKAFDHSEIWRESIETFPNTYKTDDIEDRLLDEIRDYLLSLSEKDKGIFYSSFQVLSNFKWNIFKRLQLFLCYKKFDILKDQISLIFENDLFKEKFLWSELYFLLKDYFNTFSEIQQQAYFSWINKNLLDFKNGDISKRNLLRIIEPVYEYLPLDFKKTNKELVHESQSFELVYKHPPNVFRYHEPIRFFDPITEFKEDLVDKDTNELIDFMNNWEPTGMRIFESPNDLGYAISKLIIENPSKYLEFLKRFKDIKVFYLPHIIEGFGRAIHENTIFDLDFLLFQLVEISKTIVAQNELDENLKIKIFSEIEETLNFCVKYEDLNVNKEVLEIIIQITRHLIKVENPYYIKYEETENFHQESVIYYYTQFKGKSIETLIILNGKYIEEGHEPYLLQEIKKIFESILTDPIIEKELFCSMFGESLYNLFYFDKDWIIAQIEKIFPPGSDNRSKWNAAWESYIISHKQQVNEAAFNILKEQYIQAINKVQSPNISLRAKEALSTHLFLLYLHGYISLEKDSLLYRYFKQSDIDTRSRAMWDYYKNIYTYAKTLNDSKIQKYFELWDFRIELITDMVNSRKSTIKDAFNELKWYTILFSEIEIPSGEHLLRMQKITKLTNGIGELFLDRILNKLVDYITINYKLVLEIIFAYIKNKENPVWVFLTKNDIVGQIIEGLYKLLESDEDQAIYEGILDELHAKAYDISGFST